jgi:hypothetical protein
MKAPWRESTGILPWLILIATLLAIVFIFRNDLITKEYLIENKEYIDFISKTITSIAIVVGGILSYIKFFKGRILKPKLVIEASSGTIKTENGVLHWIEAEMKNIGNVAIWNHDTTIYATIHTAQSYCVKLDEFMTIPYSLKGGESIIDVGESVFENAFLLVPDDAFAVTFQIIVKNEKKSIWSRSITVSNAE